MKNTRVFNSYKNFDYYLDEVKEISLLYHKLFYRTERKFLIKYFNKIIWYMFIIDKILLIFWDLKISPPFILIKIQAFLNNQNFFRRLTTTSPNHCPCLRVIHQSVSFRNRSSSQSQIFGDNWVGP